MVKPHALQGQLHSIQGFLVGLCWVGPGRGRHLVGCKAERSGVSCVCVVCMCAASACGRVLVVALCFGMWQLCCETVPSASCTHLACDKDALARETALCNGLANCLLILVYLRCVNVPVAQLKGTQAGILACVPCCLCLEHAKAQCRHLVAITQRDCAGWA